MAVLGARPQEQRPVFRAGSVYVNVDAYPRREGTLVDGLTKADFEIVEDGKPQTVEDLELIRVAPNTPDADRRDPTTIEDSNRQAADPHNRVFVIYLDVFDVTLNGSHDARGPIIHFLTRAMGPSDLFGVMTPELAASAITFARRSETLEAELTKYWYWGEDQRQGTFARSEMERRLLLCGIDGGELVAAYRTNLTAGSVERMIDHLGNLRDERKNVLLISEGWSLPEWRPGTSRSKAPSLPTGVAPGGRLGTGSNAAGAPDRAWCDAQDAAFRSIDYPQRFRDIVARANRANVAFYPIDVGGLRTLGVLPASLGLSERYRQQQVKRLEMLHDLASGTDGRAIVNTNDLTGGVRRISDDLSAYYLLGYYSTNTEADGRFRRIEVKVKKSGVKVSARRGYLAPTTAMRRAEDTRAARPMLEPTAVDRELSRLGRLRSDARLYTAGVASAGNLDVVVEIASQESSRWPDGGSVTVAVTPKDPGGTTTIVDARIEPGARGVLVKAPITPSKAGWRVRVAVKGGSDPLEDELDVALPVAGAAIGEPLVYRAGTALRLPLRPVADYKFFRIERIHVEWPVARPLDDRTARLLNRRGETLPIPVALTERADGNRYILAADLTLAPLAGGEYVIEVSATAGAEKIQKLLAFRVLR